MNKETKNTFGKCVSKQVNLNDGVLNMMNIHRSLSEPSKDRKHKITEKANENQKINRTDYLFKVKKVKYIPHEYFFSLIIESHKDIHSSSHSSKTEASKYHTIEYFLSRLQPHTDFFLHYFL